MATGHRSPPPPRSLLGEMGGIWSRRGQIWRMVSRRDKLAFGASVLTMAVVAKVEAILPVLSRLPTRMSNSPAFRLPVDGTTVTFWVRRGLYFLRNRSCCSPMWSRTRRASKERYRAAREPLLKAI